MIPMKQYINEALKDYDNGIKAMLDFFAKKLQWSST